MKKAIEKIDEIISDICNIAEKYGVFINLDLSVSDIITNKAGEEIYVGEEKYQGGVALMEIKFPERKKWEREKRFESDAECIVKGANRPKFKLFKFNACSILNQLKDAKNDISNGDTEKGIIAIIEAMEKLSEFKNEAQRLDFRINAGKSTKGKISYNDSAVLKFYINAYIKAAKPLPEGNNNPKFIGIHGIITQDAMKEFSLSEKTLKSAFPHSRIKKEISRLE